MTEKISILSLLKPCENQIDPGEKRDLK